MLQRFARSLAPACHIRDFHSIRMSKQAQPGVSAINKSQALEAIPGPAVTTLQPVSPTQLRRSSRSRSTAFSEVSVKSLSVASAIAHTVKQEDLAELAETADVAGPGQTAAKASGRKRKQPEAVETKQEDNGLSVSAAEAGSQQPTDTLPKPHKRRAKATAKVKTELTEPAAANAVEQDSQAGVMEPADEQAKPLKRRKPQAKAVIRTETATVIDAGDGVAPPQQPDSSYDQVAGPAAATSMPSKQRTPKSKKAVVKTETVTVTDAAHDPASPSQLTDNVNSSAKKSKPRKTRAKAVVTVEQLLESVDVVPYRERVVPKKWVGAHVSMGGGLERAVVRAAAIGCNAFALDTRSKRQWESKPIDVEAADKFRQACKEYGFGPDHILPHGSYLINLASADPELLTKSYNAFVDELKRCEILGIRLYNFHPGTTCGKCPAEEGMDRIAEQINKAHAETENVTIVLENMAGAGHSVGHKFEYLRHIIDRVDNKARVGVCLDTCHLFAANYDVSNPEAFDQVMTEFDQVVGLRYLKGMHVNDSKAALGSKKDRHENVAKGLIGESCFSFLMNDDRFNSMPLIMETPVQCEGLNIDYKLSLLAGGPVYKGPSEEETGVNTDKRDIAWLNSLCKD